MANKGQKLKRAARALTTRLSGGRAIELVHAPRRFSRRAGHLSANFCGLIDGAACDFRYRVNDGDWRPLGQGAPRVEPANFTIEIEADELRAGENLLTIEAPGRGARHQSHPFVYDPAPVALPFTIDWFEYDLEAQDGIWEKIPAAGGWRVRPAPGFEGYDRILMVAGAIAGGRRVETDVVFHRPVGLGPGVEDWGFGVFPLWGGHPGAPDERPRSGWVCGVGWYFSLNGGIGVQIGQRYPGEEVHKTHVAEPFEPRPGMKYALTVEAYAETGAAGQHQWRLRLKWRAADGTASDGWIEMLDTEPYPLPPGEYAVALIAHRCQVEFGPVTVSVCDPAEPD